MGHRRQAREYALQALYMYEAVNIPLEELVALDWLESDIPDDIREFTIVLIKGSVEHIDEINQLIRKYSRNWEFERVDTVDKSILRISIYEILFLPDIPPVVTINEAIELGKIFGGENSGHFINGILDAVMKKEIKNHEIPGGTAIE